MRTPKHGTVVVVLATLCSILASCDADEPLAGDADAPLRVAVEVVDRAVERVDDPPPARGADDVVALLADDAVVRDPTGEHGDMALTAFSMNDKEAVRVAQLIVDLHRRVCQ